MLSNDPAPAEAFRMPEVDGIQVATAGQGFADSEEYLVIVQLAFEQLMQHIKGRRLLGAGLERNFQTLIMVLFHMF